MFSYLSLALWLPVFYLAPKIVWYITTLLDGRRYAAASPLPYVVVYTKRDSVIFWLLSPWLAPIIESLPFGLGHWVRFIKKDYSWASKGILQREELGSDLYFLAQPGGLHLIVSDADVICDVVHRWKDFPKPVHQYRELRIYGDNVVTAEGSTWQRHRKITSPPFNERNSSLVFEETLRHGRAMLASFTTSANGETPKAGQEPIVEDLIRWMMTVTLNVLCGAAFSLRIAWPTHSVEVPENQLSSSKIKTISPNQESTAQKLSFQQCVDIISYHLHLIIIFPDWFLRHAPSKLLNSMIQGRDDFKTYMREMISEHQTTITMEETSKISSSTSPLITNSKGNTSLPLSSSAGDLLGNIVRASSAESEKKGLSSSETISNIFIFIVAGHETTASATQTAFILLATEPKFQQLIQEEVDSIWASKKEGEDLTYEDYPKMRTIMALMLETLRLYPPVVGLPKHTLEPQTLTYRCQEIHIPASTSVSLDVVSLQRSPLYWNPSPHTFIPSRWLKDKTYIPPQNSTNESPDHPNLFCPYKGSFLAFSGGFRACLGKKFAQVEFCTLIAVVVRGYSVELVREGEETYDSARERALEALEARRTVLAMRLTGKVKLRFVRRGEEGFPSRG